MDEIITNLWIGDLPSALDVEKLKQHNIRSIISVMRGKLSVRETFIRHQIEIDDSEDADILVHLVSAITFIQKELDKDRGVLVHCQAGVSRSATIVVAYLMYARGLDANAALNLIREHRPQAEPNDGFLAQLNIFHQASFKISNYDKATRMFYLGRVMKQVMNGDGSIDTEMFSKYPQIQSSSSSRRRIRCKMCRQELGTREHMIGHRLDAPPDELLHSEDISSEVSHVDPQLAVDGAVKLGEELSDSLDSSSSSIRPPSAQGSELPPLTGSSRNSSSGPSIPLDNNSQPASLRSPETSSAQHNSSAKSETPLLLADPKCSGYFIEPMKWMESSLPEGQMAGKIICPNKRCKAKLGNYDWAGVCCSCKEWVVPGFCIHRSKVDEIE